MPRKGTVAIIVPSLDPDHRFAALVDQLLPLGMPVVLVNDGSRPENRHFFDEAAQKGCAVLTHSVNLGKGRALKTAFNYCLNTWPDLVGTVTADGDGQHSVADILRCADALREHPDALVMGCRDFSAENVPFNSRYGNRITRTVMGALTGVRVTDTQTGLRAICAPFMARLMNVKGERFEFETNMLLETAAKGETPAVPIVEVAIETIYIGENETSHFHPLKDSLRIYALFGKFIAASASSSVVDLVLFSVFLTLFGGGLAGLIPAGKEIAAATVAARILSGVFNFAVNRSLVFQSGKSAAQSAWKYAVLWLVVMASSAWLVTFFTGLLHWAPVVVKLMVDLVLFLLSFQIQRRVVFR